MFTPILFVLYLQHYVGIHARGEVVIFIRNVELHQGGKIILSN